MRWRVTKAGCTPGLYVWVAFPYIVGRPLMFVSRAFGRRVIELPADAVLAATWAEAMAYATRGTTPAPVHLNPKYREWCGR
ncbi:hypothetical protein ACQ856_18205 [Mycolicibacterium psychrotolerans]|uniref:hypothetical protein n=1 Tax=Mycolicibacterium psychrotolerans TaxID=216929 RepID=UPI003D6710A5